MCGIFGQISKESINYSNIIKLAKHSTRRGKDSSGLIYYENNNYKVHKADYDIEKLLKKIKPTKSKIVLGHSRLITNGLHDNQPVIRDNIAVIHNGIIVNENEIWKKLNVERKNQFDYRLYSPSEIIKEFMNYKPLSIYCSKFILKVNKPTNFILRIFNFLFPTYIIILKSKNDF